MFARAIHANSNRGSRSFVTVDCGALPETLVESTLFGHERGAFTGADKKQDGLILQADGGTLFCDEIGDLPLTIQKALLRALQERRIRPLGGKQEIPVDFRLLSATNLNLDSMVREKRFRADLLFRIRAIEIKLPPLRDRGPDMQEIAIRTVQRLGRRYGIGLKGISPEFLESLGAHDWPGNVSELINVMEYALAAAKSDPTLFPKHLPPEFRTAQLDFGSVSVKEPAMPMEDMPRIGEVFPPWSVFQETAEKDYLQQLMMRAGGSREKACRLSGISQSRLYGLLKKHNLSRFRSS
ncbi:MAG: sigma 54-interacting transcriptional regulator [Pseudomonadota bacterium]